MVGARRRARQSSPGLCPGETRGPRKTAAAKAVATGRAWRVAAAFAAAHGTPSGFPRQSRGLVCESAPSRASTSFGPFSRTVVNKIPKLRPLGWKPVLLGEDCRKQGCRRYEKQTDVFTTDAVVWHRHSCLCALGDRHSLFSTGSCREPTRDEENGEVNPLTVEPSLRLLHSGYGQESNCRFCVRRVRQSVEQMARALYGLPCLELVRGRGGTRGSGAPCFDEC